MENGGTVLVSPQSERQVGHVFNFPWRTFPVTVSTTLVSRLFFPHLYTNCSCITRTVTFQLTCVLANRKCPY